MMVYIHQSGVTSLALSAGKEVETTEDWGSHGLLPRLVLDSYGDLRRVPVSPISRLIGGAAATLG